MKTLSFAYGAEVRVPFLAGSADEVALAMGPDGLPRIAAHIGKEVWYARRSQSGVWAVDLVARASTDGGAWSMPVVDVYAISIASSSVADVVAWRNRTKGGSPAMQIWHGPCMTVIPQGQLPGRAQAKLFTVGACRVIFDDAANPALVEMWSKDGNWRMFDVSNPVDSPEAVAGRDNIGATGEKMCRVAGGWSAYGGCTENDSRFMRRGGASVKWMSGDKYPDIGDDMNYPGLGVQPAAVPKAYLATQYHGRMLVQRVANGVPAFPITALPSIGAAASIGRHAPQLVLSKGRMAAIWTGGGGKIMAGDVDGLLAAVGAPQVLCDGSKAAAVKAGAGIALATLRKGVVYFGQVTTVKK